MNSIEVIRKLSNEGANNFINVLSWINPIPENGNDIIEKIDFALKRSHYAEDRQGSMESTEKEQLILMSLKKEIQNVLNEK